MSDAKKSPAPTTAAKTSSIMSKPHAGSPSHHDSGDGKRRGIGFKSKEDGEGGKSIDEAARRVRRVPTTGQLLQPPKSAHSCVADPNAFDYLDEEERKELEVEYEEEEVEEEVSEVEESKDKDKDGKKEENEANKKAESNGGKESIKSPPPLIAEEDSRSKAPKKK